MGNYKVYLGLNQTIMCHVPSTSIANHAQVICTHYYWEAVVSPENFQLVLTESYSSTFSASTATRLVSSPRCWRCPPTVPWRRRKVLISIQEACQGTYMYTVRKECFTSVIMLCVYTCTSWKGVWCAASFHNLIGIHFWWHRKLFYLCQEVIHRRSTGCWS